MVASPFAAGMAFGWIGCAGFTQLSEQLRARWSEGDERP
jgi:hypothetical protein